MIYDRNVFLLLALIAWSLNSASQNTVVKSSSIVRDSPVNYHLSFDDDEFFKEDIIEQSGKKSLEERRIDFPAGKFGQGIRMREIPPVPDANNMTGIDLDLVTAVIFNTHPGNEMGFNQPFIWGSGRINARLGSVAFWARGELAFACPLFEQTSIGFGRKERNLLGIVVDAENQLSAYVRDARYITHQVESKTAWNPEQWNHVVFNWDWANGLELWINGEIIASSWGEDSWFETSLPGLFHLPAPGLIFDELYLFDRPVSKPEIEDLMRKNTAPGEETAQYQRTNFRDSDVAKMSGSEVSENLPTVLPDKIVRFIEVWPEEVSDGYIPGWFVVDGRNEIAWPHPYSMFTIIPGDADFHAEKVDIKTAPHSKVNYMALTGNLSNVRVQSATDRSPEMSEVLEVPGGNQFFYGTSIRQQEGATFRIPFTEGYGTPSGFSGDINVPLSGEKRIQNIGLYYWETTDKSHAIEGRRLVLNKSDQDLDSRTQFAIHAVTSRDERNIVFASEAGERTSEEMDIGAYARLNILSDPYFETTGLKSISLSLPIKTKNREEVLTIRVRDPGVPSRLWNQFAIKLSGFDKSFKTLLLNIDFQDLVLTGGDRIWLDLGTTGSTIVLVGNQENKAVMYIDETEPYLVIDDYARKEIVSAQAQYAKMYEFMPWQFTNRSVSIANPYCYGGPFDMILPALAIKRVMSDHFVANYLIKMCGPEFKDGKPLYPDQTPLISLPNPTGAPEWALFMRDFNLKRHKIADWWADRQNQDGQLGGGWNDDVLFLSSHQPDLPLDGNENARYLIDATHKGLENTNYFKDGYCNIYPMDRMHIGDFISERYNSLVNNLGQAYAFERELEAAWRLDDRKKTPINYFAEGFKSSVNVFSWYWGKDVPESPYVSRSLDSLAAEFRLYTSVLDENSFYRFTESNVHRDDYSPYGANNMYTYMLGGRRGSRLDAHLKLAVTWPGGGGPDMARVVLYADDDSLSVATYSFSSQTKNLLMQLCRIEKGNYHIMLLEDPGGEDKEGKVLWQDRKELNRFDVVEIPVPPQMPVEIVVQQIEALDQSSTLPDLAIDLWDAEFENSSIECTIHNLGNEEAKNVTVRLSDGDVILEEQMIESIPAPVDFKAKRHMLNFENVSFSGNLKISIDPKNQIEEILEDNNRIYVYKKGTFKKGLAPKRRSK